MYWLLPFKGLKEAKSRWTGLGLKRAELVLMLLQRSLETVAEVAGRENVFLVTPDRSTALSTGFPYLTVSGGGLNEDLRSARQQLTLTRPASSLAVLLPDLPSLGTGDIASLERESARHSVVLCPDTSDSGTNAIALSPWDSLDFLFEGASFERFQKAADGLQRGVKILRRPGLARDCDSLTDLERYCLI